ncbi:MULTISPECIES: riboflavin synthase [Cysteiniphilum]|uniref:Riboflavin synthase n=1 Tax=Cysteiniphilum litorale TaxID=2056700 RepID=A0A8J3E8K8_9GAMM|nr:MULTISPECIES: riboflavin synthase [Cysteiniphilum]GGF95954.1 riboflavin synthase subunit alpha [Cysteiniphilum litorale]
MFSGIVQEVATVDSVLGSDLITLVIRSEQLASCKIGDSIAINGVCLTVVTLDKVKGLVSFEAVPETLRKTTLGQLVAGSHVNLELSLRLNDFIGGHMVQGHVDGVGEVKSITHEAEAWLVAISAPLEILRYLVNKGFITIDGMSITVIEVKGDYFTVTFIPHTIDATIVKNYQVGTKVNLEADPIGKHIHHYMEKIQYVSKN